MNWFEMGQMLAVVVPVVGGFGWLIAQKMDAMKGEIMVQIAKDKQDVRDWINGSFMRGGETRARLESVHEKLGDLCDRVERVEGKL